MVAALGTPAGACERAPSGTSKSSDLQRRRRGCPAVVRCSRQLARQSSEGASLQHSLEARQTRHGSSIEEISESPSSVNVPRRGIIAAVFSAPLLATCFPDSAPAASGSEYENAVREAVRSALTPAKCPGVLRLAFHDAGTFDLATGTGGANGSVIHELGRPESDGLKRYVKLLGKVKDELAKNSIEASWADLIAVGGAEAVKMCGGPSIPVRLGRQDSGIADAEGRMPAETFNADQVIKSFSGKGFSVQETVALLGGHTLGGKGFGDPTVFDNSYFSILLQRPWNKKEDKMAYMIGLPSDHAIVEDSDAEKWIKIYSEDEPRFFNDFTAAYLKMVDSGAMWLG